MSLFQTSRSLNPRHLAGLLCGTVLLTGSTGCATILNDSTQPVAFSSDPQGAVVYVDDVAMGITPVTIPVQRAGWSKAVRFELDGHKTTSVTLRNTLSGSTAGNILLGGIIGFGIDAISGRAGGYQNSLHVVMEPGGGHVDLDGE